MRIAAWFRILLAVLFAGAVVVIAESCSGGSATCLASNCAGCCSDQNTCLSFDKQGFTACGAGGLTCHACVPGQVCNQGNCVTGTGDGGGPTDSGTPGRDAGTGGQDAGGSFCPACGQQNTPCCTNGSCCSGLTCSAGYCVTSAGTHLIGDACATNSDCASGLCLTGAAVPGGYCSKNCLSDANCPSGSVCGANPTGGTQDVCLNTCVQAGQAGSAGGCNRTDHTYVCEKKNTSLSGAAVCWPQCPNVSCGNLTCDPRGFCCGAPTYACCGGPGGTCPNGGTCGSDGYCHSGSTQDGGTTDAGSGQNDAGSGNNGGVGSSCTSNGQCTTNNCYNTWPGGYCSETCGACPSGSSCTDYSASLPISPTTSPMCLENCSAPLSQSNCPSGYLCDRGWSPNFAQGTCVPRCNSNNDCPFTGSQCTNGFCCGGVGSSCCGGVGGTCPYGGTCSSDGYCHCSASDCSGSTCGSDGFCCGASGLPCCGGGVGGTCPNGGTCQSDGWCH